MMMTGLQLQRSCTFHGQDNRTIHQLTSGHRSAVVNANCLLTKLALLEVSWRVVLSRNTYNPWKSQTKTSILTSNHKFNIYPHVWETINESLLLLFFHRVMMMVHSQGQWFLVSSVSLVLLLRHTTLIWF